MSVIDPEAQRAGIEKWAKYGIIAAAAAISYPVAVLAFQGLMVWTAFALAVGVISNFSPVIATYIANKRIQAMIAVIEANPIETMKNLYALKQMELTTAQNCIRDFETELGNFRTQVESVREEYPDDVVTYLEIQARMEDALADMKQEQTLATQELAVFKSKIKKAETLFNMAKAANKMLEKSASAQEQVFNEIKESVSFTKVRNDLNRAFANLNSAVEQRKNAAILKGRGNDVKVLPERTQTAEVVDLGTARQKTAVRRQ